MLPFCWRCQPRHKLPRTAALTHVGFRPEKLLALGTANRKGAVIIRSAPLGTTTQAKESAAGMVLGGMGVAQSNGGLSIGRAALLAA